MTRWKCVDSQLTFLLVLVHKELGSKRADIHNVTVGGGGGGGGGVVEYSTTHRFSDSHCLTASASANIRFGFLISKPDHAHHRDRYQCMISWVDSCHGYGVISGTIFVCCDRCHMQSHARSKNFNHLKQRSTSLTSIFCSMFFLKEELRRRIAKARTSRPVVCFQRTFRRFQSALSLVKVDSERRLSRVSLSRELSLCCLSRRTLSSAERDQGAFLVFSDVLWPELRQRLGDGLVVWVWPWPPASCRTVYNRSHVHHDVCTGRSFLYTALLCITSIDGFFFFFFTSQGYHTFSFIQSCIHEPHILVYIFLVTLR